MIQAAHDAQNLDHPMLGDGRPSEISITVTGQKKKHRAKPNANAGNGSKSIGN